MLAQAELVDFVFEKVIHTIVNVILTRVRRVLRFKTGVYTIRSAPFPWAPHSRRALLLLLLFLPG